MQSPEALFRGTVPAFLSSIREHGLNERSRQYVRLASDIEIANHAGQRRGKSIVLQVASGAMRTAGHPF